MSNLFSPIQIGALTLKNRFVRSATHDWLAYDTGIISDKQIALYKKLAVNNIGLIITAHSYVEHPRGRASLKQNGIYSDLFIDGYQKLVNSVRPYGAKLIVQLAHAGVQTTKELTEGAEFADPNKLSLTEIEDLIENFALAVKRVQAADCDGAQIHMAHGYLLARFLSPDTNKRQDEWGGSLANRAKVVISIVKRARERVGRDFPLLVKLNSCGGFSGTGAIELTDVLSIAQFLEAAGVDGIEISGGIAGEIKESTSRVGILTARDEAYHLEAAKAVKKVVSIPVIVVGGLRSRQVMDNVISSHSADMIAMSRPFICEPDLITKIAAGADKVKCVSCNKCFNREGIHCILNLPNCD